MDPLSSPRPLKCGDLAPDFSLPDLDGIIHSLLQHRGRIVVLNFWSAECPWSERADEQLLSYMPEWDGSVTLLPVASNANEEAEMLRQAANKRNLPFVLQDADQKAADLYSAVTTPHLFVIDEQGILRYQGAFDDVTFRQRSPTRFYLREAVEALLSGRDPDPAETSPYGCTVVRYWK